MMVLAATAAQNSSSEASSSEHGERGGLVGPTDTCGGGAIVLGQAEVQGGGEGHVAKGGRDGAGPDAAGVS